MMSQTNTDPVDVAERIAEREGVPISNARRARSARLNVDEEFIAEVRETKNIIAVDVDRDDFESEVRRLLRHYSDE